MIGRILTAIAFGIYAGAAWAQIDTGTIAGSVKDASGGFVAGATILIRNNDTGIERSIITNEIGQYVSGPLPPGFYTVSAVMPGFQETITRLALAVNQRAVVDLTLEVGASEQKVTVTAAAPLLESETSAIGNIRTEQAVKDLPLNGRNFSELIGLTAGVVPAQSQVTSALAATAVRGTTMNSVNGMGARANRYLVDGLDDGESHNGQGVLIYPPVEAIQEFSVETSVPPAEFGRGGANVNIRMRSGTREFHGAAFEFLRNSALDAKNFFDPPGKITPFRMNQFGFVVGGPAVIPHAFNRDRNQTFFFFDYEGIRTRQAQTSLSTVPTPAMKTGNFSGQPNQIYDPLSVTQTAQGLQRAPYPNNTIPASELDKVGRNLVNLYPDPNLGGITSNFLYTPTQTLDANNWDLKIDQYFGTANQTFFRYSRHYTSEFTPGNLPAPAWGNTGAGVFDYPLHQFVASYTHTFSPRMVNEARAGIGRLYILTEQANYGVNVADQVGIPGINSGNDVLRSGLPNINVTGYQNMGDSGFKPGIIVSENWQFDDNVSWFTGSHSFKFGGELMRRRYNLLQSTAAHGIYNFTGIYTQNLITPAKSGNGLADLLLGSPADGNISALSGTRGYRRWETAVFIQDNWKWTSRLTVNWGLRYEIFPGYPWVEVHDRMANFLPSRGDVFVVGTKDLPSRSATKTGWKDFGPRLGIAYKLGTRTVLRSAYGIYYQAEPIPETNLPGANPPFNGSTAFANNKSDFAGAVKIERGFPGSQSTVFPTAGAALFAIDPNLRLPYTQQWNAGVQRQLTAEFVLSISYVGTKGTALLITPDANQPLPGATAVNLRRPYPAFNSITTEASIGSSIYHSLQITADKRLSKGVSFQFAYTWSHELDNGDFNSTPQNSRAISAERGNGAFDSRQRLTGSWTWMLPGRGMLLGGWQANGIASIYQGLPFTVTSAINTLNIGGGTQRADRIGGGSLPASQRSIHEWFDINAFTTPGVYLFGNSGRNILSGPGTLQFDTSVFKDFHFTRRERTYAQFRAEFFNVANRPQFNNPASAIGNPAAGTITSAGSKPTLQRTSRQIQLALKLFF